jgi:uncharacterized membrane protein (DUF2068 family)
MTNRGSGPLLLIGAFKMAKAATLLALGVVALAMVHKDPASHIEHWLQELNVDPGNRYLQALLARTGLLSDRRLAELGAGSFLYAGLFAVEGIGLLLRRRWGEYLTIVVTGSFIPLELYHLTKHPTPLKAAVVAVNVAIVAYLVWRVRDERGDDGR